MFLRIPLSLGLAFIGLFVSFAACTDQSSAPTSYEVSLHSGVRGFANIGDLESDLLKSAKSTSERVEIPAGSAGGVAFTHALRFKDLGARVYFLHSRVALIEIQEPFHGNIQGRAMQLFVFGPPPAADKTWDAVLVKEFGFPQARVSGGRFGSEALFYPWGDVSFNNNGPNQLALYREPAIATFRQKNFGRDISFFSR